MRMRAIHIVLLAIIVGLFATSAFARNDGGNNGAGCIDNCGHHGGGGVSEPPVPVPGTVINNSTSSSTSIENRPYTALQQHSSNDFTSNTVNNYDASGTYDKYVAPAYAPPLTTGHCMGSASAGGSGAAFGFSLGKTYIDENCNARYDTILLYDMGLRGAAILRQCQRPAMAEALGDLCPEKYHVPATADGRWWAE